ncbi:iron dicitrate transport regulator FecR [Pseudoxanthomonas jiangsuensis]|uniref:FecR family protein n=1 Tax=Pseudoxanthomonas jiangsuensis TaxID=619688 RepID=UPI001391027A|nr:FecR domain-containing protein [Pseudoxanthomonas jiangsuensis]KAF1695185.1 iron dicitrate transport regulator FecR [Pseudoxanthomonas jiangsuensis]
MSATLPPAAHGPAARDAVLEAARWYSLQREGVLDQAQQARFMDWLLASPAHLREYLAVGHVAIELGEALRAAPDDVDALLRAAEADGDGGNVVRLPLARTATPRAAAVAAPARRWPRLASAAAVLLGLALGVHAGWPRTSHHVAGHGQPRSFVLADGTRVHLNAESELTARYTPWGRQVELVRGQAGFVVADGLRPFAVRAAGLRVRDIGTTFEVWLQRDQARIGVADGRVQVFDDAGDGRLLADLGAGHGARIGYADRAVVLADEDPAAMNAWWRRRIGFRDEPLHEVAERFNRMNRVRLQVDDPMAGALRLTGNLDAADVESLHAFLRQQPSLATHLQDGRIHVGSRAASPASR